MGVAVTDHVFVDGGHTIDFTNKAFELLGHLGWERAERRAPHARPGDRAGPGAPRRRASGAIPTTFPASSTPSSQRRPTIGTVAESAGSAL